MRSQNQLQTLKQWGALCALVLSSLCSARAQVAPLTPLTTTPIFSDDFAGTSLDAAQWSYYDANTFYGRTRFGNTPGITKDADGTSFLRVPLQTFNPTAGQAGESFFGTEVISKQFWPLGAGLEYETRVRVMKDIPAGVVLAFFGYGFSGQWPDSYQQTEVDTEFLTTQDGGKVHVNLWDDWNPLRGGARADVAGFTPLQSVPNLNWKDGGWHKFKFRWYPDHTEWIVDERWSYTENRVRPGAPMGVRFNTWVPASDWPVAYSSALLPATTLAANKIYTLDVDYFRVRPIPAPSRGVWGDGTGLSAVYFDNNDFSGASVARIDPRLNFNWGPSSPTPSLGADTWTTRWTGWIQPQFSEDYTLTLRTDDGVRLYLNNVKVIDALVARSATDSTYTLKATAGQKIPITIEYLESGGDASCRFFWSSTSTPKQIVPQSQLYPAATPNPTPLPTPTPTPTATPTPTPTPFVVARPVFSPPAGTYGGPQQVAITSTTTGAIIYYTADGSQPTLASPTLPAGQKVSVPKSMLLRAYALVPGRGQSSLVSPWYSISDVTAPQAAFLSPLANSVATAFGTIAGNARDETGGSGIKFVTLRLTRLSDNLRWTGWSWVAEDYKMKTTLTTTSNPMSINWSVPDPMPTGANLLAGSYELKAIATDNFWNVGSTVQTITIIASAAPS